MAPIRKRPSIRSRAERSAKDPRGIYAPPLDPVDKNLVDNAEPHALGILKRTDVQSVPDESWRLNKRDKRTIKHNTLLNKVHDSGIQKSQSSKRRRPGKKLAAANDLGTLADALPDLDEPASDNEDEWEGIEDDGQDRSMTNSDVGTMRKVSRKRRTLVESGGKMVMKSAKSRPGAMKRKHKMEQGEMDRFRKNLAQMTGSASGGERGVTDQASGSNGGIQQADRWKALRAFIGGTMQKDSAFA
nr:hypothetical protein CFP56_25885 [Quercus suber]